MSHRGPVVNISRTTYQIPRRVIKPYKIPNFTVEWLTLLLCLQEVRVEISAWRPTIQTEVLFSYSSVPPGKCLYIPIILTTTAFFHILSSSSFIHLFDTVHVACKLHAVDMDYLRRSARKSKLERVPNEEIRRIMQAQKNSIV
jgi:hypothetical protein